MVASCLSFQALFYLRPELPSYHTDLFRDKILQVAEYWLGHSGVGTQWGWDTVGLGHSILGPDLLCNIPGAITTHNRHEILVEHSTLLLEELGSIFLINLKSSHGVKFTNRHGNHGFFHS